MERSKTSVSELLKPDEPTPKDDLEAIVNAFGKEWVQALRNALLYMDSMGEFAPDLRAMDAHSRLVFVLAYAKPVHSAGVVAQDMMPTAVEWVVRHKEFPKAPGRFIELARAIRQDRLVREGAYRQSLPRSAEPRRMSPEERAAFDAERAARRARMRITEEDIRIARERKRDG